MPAADGPSFRCVSFAGLSLAAAGLAAGLSPDAFALSPGSSAFSVGHVVMLSH